MLLAYRCALASPRVSAAAIEASEFPALAAEHDVRSVPTIVIDGAPQFGGAVSERLFVARLAAPAFE